MHAVTDEIKQNLHRHNDRTKKTFQRCQRSI